MIGAFSANFCLPQSIIGFTTIKYLFTVPKSLKQRKDIGVDPFQKGFSHASDTKFWRDQLNQLRLCFQVFLKPPKKPLIPIYPPIVSDIIFNATFNRDLNICHFSDNCAPVLGHKKIILLCERLSSKDDIEIHFSYQDKCK